MANKKTKINSKIYDVTDRATNYYTTTIHILFNNSRK